MREKRILLNVDTWSEEDLKIAYQLKRRAEFLKIAVIVGLCLVFLVIMRGFGYASDRIDLSIIASIESSGNPKAYNKHSKAVGLCQITPIVLVEYNRHHTAGFRTADLYNGKVNLLVATWYMNVRIPQMLRAYHIADTTKNRLWAYNAGISLVKRGFLPAETRNYIAKYKLMEGAKTT